LTGKKIKTDNSIELKKCKDTALIWGEMKD
jgi:hypothetical protein